MQTWLNGIKFSVTIEKIFRYKFKEFEISLKTILSLFIKLSLTLSNTIKITKRFLWIFCPPVQISN